MSKPVADTDLTISADAFRRYFSAPAFILAPLGLAEQLSSFLTNDVEILRVSSAGHISAVSEPVEQAGLSANGYRTLLRDFAPVGLLAILYDLDTKAFAEKLIEPFRFSQAHSQPVMLAVEGDAQAVMAALAPHMLAHVSRLQKQLGKRDQQISHLRRKSETLLFNLEKSRETLDAMGVDRLFLVADLAPGDSCIGPSGDMKSVFLEQGLPVDSAGLSALDLHVKPGAADWQGSLICSLVRMADRRVLWRDTLPSAYLVSGGIKRLEIRPRDGGEGGEAALVLEWLGDTEGAPSLYVADVEADRFGQTDSAGDSLMSPLAMSLYRGLQSYAKPKKLMEGTGSFIEAISWRDLDFRYAAWHYSGEDEALERHVEKLGGHPIFVSNADHYLQCHPMFGEQAGVVFPGLMRAGDIAFSAIIGTEHSLGPKASYHVAVVKAGAEADQHGVYADNDIIAKKAQLMGVENAANLLLVLDQPLEEAADLALWVTVADEEIAYARCRFRSLVIGRTATERLMLPDADESARTHMSRVRLYRYRYPDLINRLHFIGGGEQHAELTAELGFQPLLVQDDGGYMQTHPLEECVSGAVLSNGVPVGARRVTSDARIAHHDTPKMLFVMALLDGDAQSLSDRAITMMDMLKGSHNLEDFDEADGGIALEGDFGRAQIAATPLKGMQLKRLSVDADGFTSVSHIVWAVLPVEGSIAFGWCRWQNLQIETLVTETEND